MKILVNATTCVVGGGVQVATAFITQAIRDSKGILFTFAVSSQVMRNLGEMAKQDKRVHEITPSPARLWDGRRSRVQLHSIESEFHPDVVFTIFGPSYLRFRATHICGLATGWVTHRSRMALSALSLTRKVYTLALCRYKLWHLSTKDYYWVEAEVARKGLVGLLDINPTRVKVIPNSYADVFEQNIQEYPNQKTNGITYILCLSAPYPHKNLCIIPEVAKLLRHKDSERSYCFIVTLPKKGSEVRKFWAKVENCGVASLIENIGPLKLSECPRWYAKSDIVFLPTLLETFSATYPEAMKMGKPIITTDLDFAHDICGNAASYYSPLSAEAASDAIIKVATNPKFRDTLVENGRKRLEQFPNPEMKYHLMLQWIEEVAKMRK